MKWDGLTTPYWRTPGQAVQPGEFTLKAIAHQATGLVNDEVFELRMEPANWGEIVFQP